MVVEKTFIMVKPDGIQRGLTGEILTRFEKSGFKIIGMKFIHVEKEFAEKHYSDLSDKPFFGSLVDFLSGAPVFAFVIEGASAISRVRKMVGETEPSASAPGTIRGDFAHMDFKRADSTGSPLPNLIHASDSVEGAEKEIGLWFSKEELFENYETVHNKYM